MAGAKKQALTKQASKHPSKKRPSKKRPRKPKASRKQALAHPTFHPFKYLPTELRLKIWKEGLPDSRVIELEYTSGGLWWAPLESQQTPGLLTANTESRAVFLKYYSVLCRYAPSDYTPKNVARQEEDYGKPLPYPAHYVDPQADMSGFQICYFDPDVDILYLGPSTSYQFGLCGGGNYPVFGFTDSEERRVNATYSEDSIDALAKIPCLSRLRFLVVQWMEWSSYHRSRLPFAHHNTTTTWAVRNDVQLLSQFPALEKMRISSGDISWSLYYRSVAKGCKGAPMKISFTEGRCHGYEEFRESFRLFNRSSLTGWKVDWGHKQVLRGGRMSKCGAWSWDT